MPSILENFNSNLLEKNQFLFFHTNISQKAIDAMHIAKIIKTDVFGANLFSLSNLTDSIHKFIAKVLDSNTSNKNEISSQIINLIEKVKLSSECNDLEIVLRSQKAAQQINITKNSTCYYWHLDKKIYTESKYIYLHVLKGEGTLYFRANESEKKNFIAIANETNFFYGHAGSTCDASDEINLLFRDKQMISTVPPNYGSVHLLGDSGTIHSAPSTNHEERLLLMLTPFNHSFEEL